MKGVVKTETFENLPEDKQRKILIAIFTCFGKNGYRKTSVADIANKADVSKASIFNYFSTKENIYHYAYQFAIDLILADLDIAAKEDFFECLYEISNVKFAVFIKYPGTLEFLSASVLEEDPTISSWLKQRNTTYVEEGYQKIFANVKYDKFKEGIDIRKVYEIVSWVNEGYVKSNIAKKDQDEMRKELNEYLEMLKRVFYKEEYL